MFVTLDKRRQTVWLAQVGKEKVVEDEIDSSDRALFGNERNLDFMPRVMGSP